MALLIVWVWYSHFPANTPHLTAQGRRPQRECRTKARCQPRPPLFEEGAKRLGDKPLTEMEGANVRQDTQSAPAVGTCDVLLPLQNITSI